VSDTTNSREYSVTHKQNVDDERTVSWSLAVERLVPFHFSRRYEDDPLPGYDEVRAAC